MASIRCFIYSMLAPAGLWLLAGIPVTTAAPVPTPAGEVAGMIETAQGQMDQARVAVEGFREAVRSWCRQPEQESPDELRRAWLSMMRAWEKTEAWFVGPLTENREARRNRIHSWPLAQDCMVDREVLKTGDDRTAMPANPAAFGLSALEYLAYKNPPEFACPQALPDTPRWYALTAADRYAAHCRYTLLIADGLHGDLTRLQESAAGWSSALAGTDENGVLHEFGFAFAYLRDFVLGMKLEKATRATKDCTHVNCVEFPASGASLDALDANLSSLHDLWQTFASALQGHSEEGALLAGKIAILWDQAGATLAELSGGPTLGERAAAMPFQGCSIPDSAADAELCRFYEEVEALSQAIVGEALPVLGIDIPVRVTGDSD